MSRIRTVKPEYFTHPEVACLSIPARLLLLSLFTQVDNGGRMYDQPRKIGANAFGECDDVDTEALLTELEGGGRIVRYQIEGKRLLAVVNFARHQKVDPRWSSPLPAPPSNGVDRVRHTKRSVRHTGDGARHTNLTPLEQGTGNREQGTGKGITHDERALSVRASSRLAGEEPQEPSGLAGKAPADPDPPAPALRDRVKDALALAWQGTTQLTPGAWARTERPASRLLAAGMGDTGLAPGELPDAIGRMRELWEVLHGPGIPLPPETVEREWGALLSGEMGRRAAALQAEHDRRLQVQRRIAAERGVR